MLLRTRCLITALLFCLLHTANANEVELPPNNASIDEIIRFITDNGTDNSAQVAQYIEDNQLLEKKIKNQETQTKLLTAVANTYRYKGDKEQAIQIALEATKFAKKTKISHQVHADALFVLAGIYTDIAQHNKAILALQSIVTLFPADASDNQVGMAYQALGDSFSYQGNYRDAFDNLFKSIFIFKANKEQIQLAIAYGRLGSLYRSIGDFDRALENMLKSLKALEGTNNTRRIAITYNNTAIIYKDLGRYEEAIEMHTRSLNLKQQIGYQRGMVYSYNNLGETHRLNGDLVESQRQLDLAQALAVELNNLTLLGSTYLYRARIAKNQNKLEQALTHLNEAMVIYKKRNARSRISEALVEYGDIYLLQNKPTLAEESYREAISLSQAVSKNVVTFAAYKGLVNLLQAQKKYKAAFFELTTYQALQSSLNDKQSQQRLESLIVEGQLFNSQQKLKLAQQDAQLKEAELARLTAKRNWLIFTLIIAFIIIWLFYLKRQHKVHAELEKAARKEIAESEQQLNLALWGSGDILWDWNLQNGSIKRQNLPVDSRFDSQTKGNSIECVKDMVHPDDFANLESAFKQHIINETPYFEASYRILNKHGEWRWLLDRGKAVDRDENGIATRIAGTQRDISALKKNEVALQTLNNELEERVMERTFELNKTNSELMFTIEKLEIAQEYLIEAEKHAALGGMVAGLAHEINTPLGTAITAVSHLKSTTSNTESQFKSKTLSSKGFETFIDEVHSSSSLIESGVGKAGELVARFKLLASTKESQSIDIFKIRELIEHSFKIVQNTLEVSTACQLKVIGDAALTSYKATFAQVLTILIENTLIHADSESLVITCKINQTPQGVELEYTDNGKGIEQGMEKRIFEPFYTSLRTQGHSGLGLHIAYNNITQDLGGSIALESGIKQGLGFLIKIPNK